jgi:outer membrane receptor for ferrienterochelin and colicin
MRKSLLTFVLSGILLAISAVTYGQGTTTSSLNGKITDAAGDPLPGATIVATHTPSGSQYGNVSNADGFYRIPNMRVGGPYTVTVTFVGFREFKQENLFLTLGQSYKLSSTLQETSVSLDDVEVIGTRSGVFDGNRTGAETVISLDQINAIPTVARAIGDFARFTPQATIDEGNDGFSISIGGQNNRYNSIYIDGAVNNDVFGLAGSGTNGGQTGVSPISIDAIEQFQIQVAPFDVRVSGFAGGAINAVTRSGSNNIEGSVYRFWRNENFAGETPVDIDGQARTKLNEFSAETYGFRVGGPIIKDKLFFFVNYEEQRDETPQPFLLENYEGDSDRAALNSLISKLDGFGYNPGSFEDNPSILNSEKLTAKIDFNANQNNKISLRYSYVNADNIEAIRSSPRSIGFYNRSESFLSETNSLSAEWSAALGSNASNKLTFGYVNVSDDRDPTGGDFPTVSINDGRGNIQFGAEPFSTANLLDQTVFTINNNFELYKGKHTYTVGINAEFYAAENLFIARNFGQYTYDNLNDFLTDQPAEDYFRQFSNVDNITGDGSAAAAIFNSSVIGIYAQDEIQVNDDLKLTVGVRMDIQSFDDTPENAVFNSTVIPQLEANGYNLQGSRIGQFIKPQALFSPRVGFNWDINGDRTVQLRGGAGIFTSRIPLVWPGGAYNNNGFNLGSIDETGFDGVFRPDVNNQPGTQSTTVQSGNIDLFANDFKAPQVAKFNVALDKKLSNGWILTLDALYNKNINALTYQNLNMRPSTESLTGTGDYRPKYNRRDLIVPNYGGIYLAGNTARGFAYNLSSTLTVPMTNGFQGSASYSYGESFSVFDGTSSQNSSQWRGLHSIGGRNFDQPLVKSSFSQGHRIIVQTSYRYEWSENIATQIGLVYEGRVGSPYSFIYNDGGRLTNEDSRERNLIYVPLNSDDIILRDDASAGSAAFQWQQLNKFIAENPYLNSRRGKYAEVNQSRAPFVHVFDLRFMQEFSLNFGESENTFQFTADIYNFGNMMNSNWGRRYFVPSDFELLNFEGFQADGTTPEFTFDGVTNFDPSANNIDDSGLTSSRWQMQLGLRYIFGG